MNHYFQKIKMHLKSYDHRVLDRAIGEIMDVLKCNGAKVVGPIPMPRHKMKFTLNRSPHIDKEARDQFEIITYNRLLEVWCNEKTSEVLNQIVIPSDVEINIKIGGDKL